VELLRLLIRSTGDDSLRDVEQQLERQLATLRDPTDQFEAILKFRDDLTKRLRASGTREERIQELAEEELGRIFDAPGLIRKMPFGAIKRATAEQQEIMRQQQAAAEKLNTDIKSIAEEWGKIARYMATDIAQSDFGKGLKSLADMLKSLNDYLKQEATKPEGAKEGEGGDLLGRLTGKVSGPLREFLKRGFHSGAGAGEQPASQDTPQQLVDERKLEQLPDFSNLKINPEAWDAWLASRPESQNIEDRRGEVEDQTDQTKLLTEQIKRTIRLLSGEEVPTGKPLGLLDTQMGGLRAGLGGGAGAGGGMGGLPGMGGGGGGDGGGGTPGGGPRGSGPRGSGPTLPDLRVSPSSQPGPMGYPMAPWGTTTAGFGGGAGLGAAGGVQGLPGSPSGPAALRGGGAPGGGPTSTYGGGTQRQQTAQIVANEMRQQGFSENAIAGMLANIKEESNFDPTLRHADQPKFGGEAHFAHGLFQDGGAEWNTWAADMRKRGLDPTVAWKDPVEQARFVAGRLKGTIGDQQYKNLTERLQAAKSPTEAARLFASGYLKPAAQYLRNRIAGFERRGVPGVESFTGPPTGQAPAVAAPTAAPTAAPSPQQPSTTQQGTSGAGRIVEAQGKEAAVRKGAISPELRQSLSYASAMTGLTVRVASGGQRMEGARGATGSHRHDRGDAADFDLIDEKGNLVPHSDPRALEFVEHAARAGVKGGGAEQGYMGPHRIHLDVVGAGRGGGPGIYRGSAALRAAYERGARARMTPQQVADELSRREQRTQVAGPSQVAPPSPAPAAPGVDVSRSLYDKLAEQDRDRLALRRLREEREKIDDEDRWRRLAAESPTMGSFTAAARRQRLQRGTFTRQPGVESERAEMDQAQGRALFHHRVRGTGKIDVTVKKGQESVTQKGPFKKVPWHRHQQMTEASQGPEAATGMTGGGGSGNLPVAD
jgi:hypothetical protein